MVKTTMIFPSSNLAWNLGVVVVKRHPQSSMFVWVMVRFGGLGFLGVVSDISKFSIVFRTGLVGSGSGTSA